MGTFITSLGLTAILIILAALILFGLITAYYFYFFRRLARLLHLSVQKLWQKIFFLVLALIFALLSVNIFSRTALVLLHFIGISCIMDGIVQIIQHIRKKKPETSTLLYKIYQCGAIPLALSFAIFGYGYYNIRHVVETTYTVTTEKTLSQESYKILLMADMHYGTTADAEMVSELTERIAQEKPDLVLLGGDMVDENTSHAQMKEVFSILGKIPSRYGIYSIFGNHDKSHYSENPSYTEEELRSTVMENGITILEDEMVSIGDDLNLLGRMDRSEPNRNTASFMQTIDSEKYTLVLDHQPVEYDIYEKYGVDLVLSGHTHSGQIFPIGYIIEPLGFADNCYGQATWGHMQGIVTSGVTGWGYPIRTQAHSEYVLITLKEAE